MAGRGETETETYNNNYYLDRGSFNKHFISFLCIVEGVEVTLLYYLYRLKSGGEGTVYPTIN